jgi:uncharacterized membrane protein YdbT with pleckstrin-like domain
MNKPAATEANTPAVPAQPKEKIVFEIQPLLLPTIMNMENLVMIGLVFLAVIAAMFFRVGLLEFLIFAVIFLIIAVPSFRSIFRAGSTSYVLTNRRLVIFTVGFGPKERSIPLEQIQDAKVRSSGLQRFYGAGDVIVYMRNLGKPVRLLGLKECKRRAEQIMQAAKKARGQA